MSELPRQQRKRSAGQVIFLLLPLGIALSLLVFFVVNVGDHVATRVEAQNAADSTALATGAWMARGMNLLSAANITQSQLLAMIVHLDAFAKTMAIVEKISWAEIVTLRVTIAALSFAGPFGAGFAIALKILLVVLETRHNYYIKPLRAFADAANNTFGKKGVLWNVMRVVEAFQHAVYFGTPVAALASSRSIAKANGADEAWVTSAPRLSSLSSTTGLLGAAVPMLPVKQGPFSEFRRCTEKWFETFYGMFFSGFFPYGPVSEMGAKGIHHSIGRAKMASMFGVSSSRGPDITYTMKSTDFAKYKNPDPGTEVLGATWEDNRWVGSDESYPGVSTTGRENCPNPAECPALRRYPALHSHWHAHTTSGLTPRSYDPSAEKRYETSHEFRTREYTAAGKHFPERTLAEHEIGGLRPEQYRKMVKSREIVEDPVTKEKRVVVTYEYRLLYHILEGEERRYQYHEYRTKVGEEDLVDPLGTSASGEWKPRPYVLVSDWRNRLEYIGLTGWKIETATVRRYFQAPVKYPFMGHELITIAESRIYSPTWDVWDSDWGYGLQAVGGPESATSTSSSGFSLLSEWVGGWFLPYMRH